MGSASNIELIATLRCERQCDWLLKPRLATSQLSKKIAQRWFEKSRFSRLPVVANFLSISPARREHRQPPRIRMPCPFVATCFVERSPRCIESGGLAFTWTATRPYDGRRPVEACSVIDFGVIQRRG
jgi:hypothetical protein